MRARWRRGANGSSDWAVHERHGPQSLGVIAVPQRGARPTPGRGRAWFLVLAPAALLALAFAAMGVVAGVDGASLAPDLPEPGSEGVSSVGLADIPAGYLQLYRRAAARFGLDWSVLAAIGKVECDHGRDPDPSCTKPGAVNEAGAGGPMQFLASTWARYGVDGDDDGRRDRWDPADAIFGAANYLRASGAPGDYARAILAYNHSDAYLRSVEAWAGRYGGAAASGAPSTPLTLGSDGESSLAAMQARTGTRVEVIPGQTARLDPLNGHLALIPADAPAVVQAMLIAANELQSLPYGPDGHPNPLGAPQEDCSSTLNYILYRSGIRPLAEIVRENPLAQDYVHWGAPGPGRWMTIYATDLPTPHVFATIAGLRIDTSHNGTDVGPNRDEDGPRWRVFGGIPTWAHWSVRHPPGL